MRVSYNVSAKQITRMHTLGCNWWVK